MQDKVLVEWVKEVNKELSAVRKDIHNYNMKSYTHAVEVEQKLMMEISELKEDFRIHQAKVNQRSALIAAVFSILVAGTSMIYGWIRISDFIK